MKTTANALYGKLEDPNTRRKIFDNSYLLMLIVVDERWQRVTIYHRGVDIASSFRIDEVKMAEKSKGQDITEIFKMFSKQMQTNI
ncbi:virion structural protein [Pseudomonas phage PA1C]|nr:virion structural protein [Pseudomonas phage PA1C]